MPIGSGRRIGGDTEVEIETTVTGETILMIGLQGAARTLLTHGPVVDVMAILETLQADPRVLKLPKSVQVFMIFLAVKLMDQCRLPKQPAPQRRPRLRRRPSV
jgi:hypothetical protein